VAHTTPTSSPRRRRRPGQRLTAVEREAAQELFLHAFSNSGNVRAAGRAAGVARSVVYGWMEHDRRFSQDYHQAEEDAADLLEAEAMRRAVAGVEEPVVSMGKLVRGDDGRPLMVRRYSDTLLLGLLRARHPLYRQAARRVEVSGPDGGAIPHAVVIAELNRKLARLAASLGTEQEEGEVEADSVPPADAPTPDSALSPWGGPRW
jgi:hypothetical protein